MQRNDVKTSFHVIGGRAVAKALDGAGRVVIDIVREAYLAHGRGETHNPDSYFLRFSDQPQNRIIALPATLQDGAWGAGLSGIKWIASFPGNLERGLQRASAVLVLNDATTGYPFALLEASRISAARTAASAALGALHLNGGSRRVTTVSFVGGGIIARSILDMLQADGWQADGWSLYDTDNRTVQDFSRRAQAVHGLAVSPVGLEEALRADLVVLATTAAVPHITQRRFCAGQVVLNISLRDLSPEIIASANNILDDIEHCLKADTSPDLAVRAFGNRDFITGTIDQLITGDIGLDPSRPSIFSPFGLGVLDLALGKWVFELALDSGTACAIDDFMFEMER